MLILACAKRKVPPLELCLCPSHAYSACFAEASNGARRAVVYFLTLAYLFFGVAILSDAFMAAVESMTAQVKTVKHKDGPPVQASLYTCLMCLQASLVVGCCWHACLRWGLL